MAVTLVVTTITSTASTETATQRADARVVRHHTRMLRASSKTFLRTKKNKNRNKNTNKNTIKNSAHTTPGLTSEEIDASVDDEKEISRFVPGRILIAGNRQCVNKCSVKKFCRQKYNYNAATTTTKNQKNQKNVCLGECHRECSVCPLSSVTNDCRTACESQCKGEDSSGDVCWHACLEHCPCEDLGNQLYDVLDLIPGMLFEIVCCCCF